MASQRFRLLISTLAIVDKDGRYAVVYVPLGDIVTVNEPLNGALVDVNWNGRTARMFACDLRERANQVQEAAG